MLTKSYAKSAENPGNTMPKSEGPNWKLLVGLAAAIIGVGAAAAFYVKRMKAAGKPIDGVIDDMIEFCKSRAAELDTLVAELCPTSS